MFIIILSSVATVMVMIAGILFYVAWQERNHGKPTDSDDTVNKRKTRRRVLCGFGATFLVGAIPIYRWALAISEKENDERSTSSKEDASMKERDRIAKLPENEITILTSKTKYALLSKIAEAFNAKYRGRYYVRLLEPAESRTGAWGILKAAGLGNSDVPEQRPVIFSPSNSVWLVMLAYQENLKSNNVPIPLDSPLLHLTPNKLAVDKVFCRRFFESPMSVITPNPVSTTVNQIFSIDPWTKISKLNTPGFFTMADADKANSGARILFSMLKEFQTTTMNGQPIRGVVSSPAFHSFLRDIHHSYHRYPAQIPKSGEIKDPAHSSRELFEYYTSLTPTDVTCLVSYECFINEETEDMAYDSRKFARVEFQHTEVNDHPFVILKADWVHPAQAEGAKQFFAYMEEIVFPADSVAHNNPDLELLRGYLSRTHLRTSNYKTGKSQGDLILRVDDYYAQNDAVESWINMK